MTIAEHDATDLSEESGSTPEPGPRERTVSAATG